MTEAPRSGGTPDKSPETIAHGQKCAYDDCLLDAACAWCMAVVEWVTRSGECAICGAEVCRGSRHNETCPIGGAGESSADTEKRLARAPEGPWTVEIEDVETTRGDSVRTWWVMRGPSWYLAQLDNEVEALAVRDALNAVAAGAEPQERAE